jgi:predicted dehydrogenase
MQFALFCSDSSAIPLIDALIARVDGHQISHVVVAPMSAANLLGGRSSATPTDDWQNLLTAKDVDAVIVGGTDPFILEGAKQIAAAGLPILFVPHAEQGSTLIYEFSLIHDDNHVTLYPLMGHRFDAAANCLRDAINEGRLGKIQFLQLGRQLVSDSSNTGLIQSDIDAAMLPDIDLLRWMIGDYDQITAIRTGVTNDRVLMQNVVLAGRSLPQSNWSIEPSEQSPKWELTVRGETGTARLFQDQQPYRWICEIDGQTVQGDARSSASGLLNDFAAAIADDAASRAEARPPKRNPWADLVKCFETVDATHRSVTRRRTIELHFEPMSERAIFKTQMTAIGCGVLIATLLLTLCYLGIALVIPLPQKILVVLRTLIFAPLVVFLVAQILLPLTRPASSSDRTSSEEPLETASKDV